MRKYLKLVILIFGFCLLSVLLIKIDYFSYLNFETLKQKKEFLINYSQNAPFKTATLFFITYVTLASLSIPGALFLALLSPSLFSFAHSYLLVTFASSFGAVFSFLIFRFFLKDFVENKFKDLIHKYHNKITQNQKPFLLSLRLIPIFPYSWVNIIYSVSNIKVAHFFILTFVGMSPGIIVNLYAGLQLSQINSVEDIFSIKVIFAFLLMAFFPVLLKPVFEKYLN